MLRRVRVPGSRRYSWIGPLFLAGFGLQGGLVGLLPTELPRGCIVYSMQYMNDRRFRMQELERRSGLPRTTIHLYLREGLLQPPDKTAANTGLYGREHVERLRMIQRLRSPEFGELSIARIRRVLDRVVKGVSLELAVQLDRAVTFTVPAGEGPERMSLSELAERTGIPESGIRRMVRIGLLIPDPFGREQGFDQVDAAMAEACHTAFGHAGLSLDDATPIVEHMTKLTGYEFGLRNRATAGISGEENARITLVLRSAANLIHQYLLSRCLEREIAALAMKKTLRNDQAG